jgi:hypothetical protein
MKYLNLSSLIFILILASCHSSEVVLRGSKASQSQQLVSENTVSFSKMSDSLAKPIHASSTQFTNKLVVDNCQPTLITPNIYSKNESQPQKVGQSIQPNIHTKKPSLSFDLEKTQASLQKARQHSPGIAGNIGHSFAIVGLVFIVVGLLLLLIGGLIIDTLGALALAFGFVFLLVWLVLAILQGLFDVIL